MLSGIIFDFDGVVLESADIKTRAFAALFGAFPGHIEQILAYHLENAGLSRYVKFRHIYQHFLHEPLPETLMESLDRRFSELVADEIRRCPFVPGVLEFL